MTSCMATALRMLLALTVLTGGLYPASVSVVGKALFSEQANGSLIRKNDMVIGSSLVGQKFVSPGYFWSRPSASNNATLPAAGSNLGPTSRALRDAVSTRRAAGLNGEMLFASGSGLDPDISPQNALAQIPRILASRGTAQHPDAEAKLKAMVNSLTQTRTFGVLGENRVNVLRLNMALDALFNG